MRSQHQHIGALRFKFEKSIDRLTETAAAAAAEEAVAAATEIKDRVARNTAVLYRAEVCRNRGVTQCPCGVYSSFYPAVDKPSYIIVQHVFVSAARLRFTLPAPATGRHFAEPTQTVSASPLF